MAATAELTTLVSMIAITNRQHGALPLPFLTLVLLNGIMLCHLTDENGIVGHVAIGTGLFLSRKLTNSRPTMVL